jgi:hypothetical protein
MPKTVEAYLRAQSPPRYMRRLVEIEAIYQLHRRELEAAYSALRSDLRREPAAFARAWEVRVKRWSFDDLNELVREHNQWYPVEVDLPMDPRTRDFVPIRGASYRRLELGPDWVLEHFPPSLDGEAGRPTIPLRAPREPA